MPFVSILYFPSARFRFILTHTRAGPTPPPTPPSPGGARSVTLWVYGNIITGATQLDGVIAQLQPHAASFSSIAYQCYGVGDDGSFQARWIQH
jgi:hypothetical protein